MNNGVGTGKDIDLVGDLANNMLGRTFCPLGDAAALPTASIVKKFGHEFEAKIKSMMVAIPAAVNNPFVVV